MYFVHSYMVEPSRQDIVIAKVEYGNILIPAIVKSENVIGVQFHPEKSANAGTGRTQPLGQVALRHQLELELATAVQLVKHIRVGLTRKAANDLAHAPGLEQGGNAVLGIAGVVVDQREVAGTLGNEAVDQLGGDSGRAESADGHNRTVGSAGQRLFYGGGYLIDHGGYYGSPCKAGL